MPSLADGQAPGADSQPYALDVRNVSKTFGSQRVLANVDLKVRPGEIRALAGENGSGKSTLVKVLAGYHDPDPGALLFVAGTSLMTHSPASSEASGLRFVHQDLALINSMTTVENLGLGYAYGTSYWRPVKWQRRRRHAQEAMSRLGYGHIDIDMTVGELAASERTAVAVARALAVDRSPPHVLILDEPTAKLPGAEVARLFDLIRAVRSDGVAVLLISHHLSEIFQIADSVTILRGGELVDTHPVSAIDEESLIESMVGHKVDVARPGSRPRGGRVTLVARGVAGDAVGCLDITAAAGEIVGIAGITGSGREAVAELLFGSRPRAGVVEINGRPIPNNRPDLSMAAGVGLVPADRRRLAILAGHDVGENISITRPSDFVRSGLFRRKLEENVARQWSLQLDIRPPEARTPVTLLSGGNAQKVVMARSLRLAPSVLLLDEPTQGVDVGAREAIHRLIEDAASAGCTVVVCSSDSEELARVCSRVLVMVRGRIESQFSAPLNAASITAACVRSIEVPNDAE